MQSNVLSTLAIALALAFGMSGSIHAEELGKSGKPLTAQQQRMKSCNAEARAQALAGDSRKAFMSSCLRGQAAASPAAAAPAPEPAAAVAAADAPVAVAKAPTARQLQRKACGEEAKAQGLKGDARKDYVKTCLARPATAAAGN